MPSATDQITHAEALDALPVGSVVLDAQGWAWQKRNPYGNDPLWHAAKARMPRANSAYLASRGPLTVLYRPGRPSDLAVEVERLRVGIETLDLDVLEDVAFNLGHTVYDATELEPAECTDECEACCIEDTVAALRALLAGREATTRTEPIEPPFFRDLTTREPCPRRGPVLCTIEDPEHLHSAIHMDGAR